MGKGAVGEKRGEGVKIVAISGATGGIGRALARAYAKPGVMLLLAGRRLDVLTDTKAFCERLGAKVEIDAYDVRDEAATVRWCRKAAALGAADSCGGCICVCGRGAQSCGRGGVLSA